MREISNMLQSYKLTLDANQRRRYALRVVQDGVIWRLSGFNRHAIATLGEGVPVNYPSASFESEAHAAEEHWNEGRLAVFCDLSNCIRTGDLLVFDTATNTMNVIEVKESDDSDEDSKQMRRARIKVDYLNLGRSEEIAPDAPLVTLSEKPHFKTHLSVLRDVLRTARRDGWAAARAGDGMVIHAVDSRALPVAAADAPARVERYRQRFSERLGLAWATASTYSWDSYDRVSRDTTKAVAANAPFSIFPLEPEDCVALCLGIAGYRTAINLSLLAATLARSGLRVVPGSLGADNATFLMIEGPGATLRVPPYLAEQLLAETLSFPAFTRVVRTAFDHVATAKEDKLHVGLGWRDEHLVWE